MTSHIIDIVLAAYLVFALPALQLRKSLRKRVATEIPRPRRYARAIAQIAALLLVLAVDWWWQGRSPDELGLDTPVSAAGQIGLLVAVLLILALIGSSWWCNRRLSEEKLSAQKVQFANNKLLPRSAGELWGFMLVALMVGAGWEILYRGFLLWLISPYIGIVGAVCVASLAYGMAHGYEGRKQFIGSIAAAFAFTIAYAITRSLWWLMLLHTMLAVSGGLSGYRMLHAGPRDLALRNAKAPR